MYPRLARLLFSPKKLMFLSLFLAGFVYVALFGTSATNLTRANDTADLYITGFGASTLAPVSGSTISVSTSIYNAGPSAATNVTASVVQPIGTYYVYNGYTSYLDNNPLTPQGTYDETTGNWTIGTLEPGHSVLLTLSVTVTTTNANDQSFAVTAEIMGSDQDDPSCVQGSGEGQDSTSPYNCYGDHHNQGTDYFGPETVAEVTSNTSMVIRPYISADLYITGFGATTLAPVSGSTISVSTTIYSGGPSTATSVTARVVQPIGTYYVYNSYTSYLDNNPLTPQGTYDETTGNWTIGTLEPGHLVTLTLSVTVTTTNANDQSFAVTAEIMGSDQDDPACPHGAGEAQDNSSPYNCFGDHHNQGSDYFGPETVAEVTTNTSMVIRPYISADLYFSGFGATTLAPVSGSTISITTSIYNGGPSTATGVTARVVQPIGTYYVYNSYTSYLDNNPLTPQGTYDETTGNWTIGTLEPGHLVTLTLSVTVTTTNANDQSFAVTAEIMGSDQDDPACPHGAGEAQDNSSPYNCFGDHHNQGSDYFGPETVAEVTTNTSMVIRPYISADLYFSGFGATTLAPVSGSTISVSTTIYNGGPSTATSVTARVVQPIGTYYVYNSYTSYLDNNPLTPQGTYDETTGNWTIGTLETGHLVTLTLSVTVTTTNANDQHFAVTAEIMGSDQDDVSCVHGTGEGQDNSSPYNCYGDHHNQGSDYFGPETVAEVTSNTSMVITPFIRSDIQLSLWLSSASPTAGNSLTHTIKVYNGGESPASNVAIHYPLPSNVVYVSSDQASYNAATGVWNISSLAVGASSVLNVQTVPLGTTLTTMTAEVLSGDQDDQSCPHGTGEGQDNTSPYNCFGDGHDQGDLRTANFTAVQSPLSADLSVAMTVDDALPALGADVTFTITVTNDGPAAASGVVIKDLLPAGFTYVSDNGAGAYVSGTGLWTVGALAVSDSASLQITATTTSSEVVINRAQITASDQIDFDSLVNDNSTNQDDDDAVSVNGVAADLMLVSHLSDSSVSLGQTTIYSIDITNDGPDDASGVTVAVNIPSGITFISDSLGSDFNPTTGIWTVGSVANGETKTIEISLEGNTVDTYNLVAEIDSSDATDPDSTPGNLAIAEDDYDSIGLAMAGSADLSLAYSLSVPSATVGDSGIYTITVSNAGPSTATGVLVTDLLPTGITYTSHTGDGDYDALTGIWSVPSLAVSQSRSLAIHVQFDLAGTATNTAEITDSFVFDTDSTFNDHIDQEDFKSISILVGASVMGNGTISGHVFSDNNHDGVQNSGEPDGYSGATVSITNGVVTYTPAIDSHGNYSQSVTVGTYTVRINGGSRTIVKGGPNPASVTVTLDATIDAGTRGIYPQGSGSAGSSGGGGSGGGGGGHSSSYSGSSSSGGSSHSSSSRSSGGGSSFYIPPVVNTPVSVVVSEPLPTSELTSPPLSCLNVQGAQPLQFKDITSSVSEKTDIDFLSSTVFRSNENQRVVQGNAGYFGGSRVLSRFELTKLVLAASCVNYADNPNANTVFTDVPNDQSEFSTVIAKAYNLGIIQGIGNQFFPQRAVTYGELFKILLGTAMRQGYPLNNQLPEKTLLGITDESFRQYADQAVAMHLIDLGSDNVFPQNTPVTRYNMVKILARYFKMLQANS